MKILVTGARGQLAGAIMEGFAGSAEVRAYTHADLDIVDSAAVERRVADDRPDVIVNCAAYNNVDGAETEAERALSVNAFAVRALARAAAASGATLVHYSTDFVFDGTSTRPYTEDDTPNPQSVYAQSKLLGEWFALETPRAYVLRVESLFGGVNARSSVDRIVEAIVDGREAKVISDRTVSPSYVADVAAATRALLERGEPGLYHCVNSGGATWVDLAREIARVMGRDAEARLVPVKTSELGLKANRPAYSVLSNAKVSRFIPMPTWQDALRRYLA